MTCNVVTMAFIINYLQIQLISYLNVFHQSGKLAPLWPIIGIVVEILLVIIIIVVLERKKAKVENKDN